MFNFFSKKKKTKDRGKGKSKSGSKSKTKSGKSKTVGENATVARTRPQPVASDPATRLAQLIVGNETDRETGAPPAPAPISASAKLDQAKVVLETGKFKAKLAPRDRKKLIQQALAIQQVQSKLLDDLDETTRRKLKNLAVDTLFQGQK